MHTEATPAQRTRRRALTLGVVVLLGLLVGTLVFILASVASAPSPRHAAGWELLAPMSDPRGETAAAVAGGRLFVIGGLGGIAAQASDLVSVYDPQTDGWTAGPPLPEPRHHAAAAGIDGAVYLIGGAASATNWSPTRTAWRLTADGDRWAALPDMPESRLGHRVVALGERLFVVGGVGEDDGADGVDVLVYDTEAGTWSVDAPLPLGRDHLAVVVVDREIWAIGGRAGGANHARVDIYDLASGTWRSGPALPEPVSGASEAAIDGVILLSGGEDPGRGLMIDRHWLLDSRATGSPAWISLPPPPLTVHGAPAVVLDGRFVIVSGASRPGGQSSTAWTGATQAYDLPR